MNCSEENLIKLWEDVKVLGKHEVYSVRGCYADKIREIYSNLINMLLLKHGIKDVSFKQEYYSIIRQEEVKRWKMAYSYPGTDPAESMEQILSAGAEETFIMTLMAQIADSYWRYNSSRETLLEHLKMADRTKFESYIDELQEFLFGQDFDADMTKEEEDAAYAILEDAICDGTSYERELQKLAVELENVQAAKCQIGDTKYVSQIYEYVSFFNGVYEEQVDLFLENFFLLLILYVNGICLNDGESSYCIGISHKIYQGNITLFQRIEQLPQSDKVVQLYQWCVQCLMSSRFDQCLDGDALLNLNGAFIRENQYLEFQALEDEGDSYCEKEYMECLNDLLAPAFLEQAEEILLTRYKYLIERKKMYPNAKKVRFGKTMHHKAKESENEREIRLKNQVRIGKKVDGSISGRMHRLCRAHLKKIKKR